MSFPDANSLPRTTHFRAVRAVFQGGGCRAAAHVGAYEAALACGVRISEVAGTSAGSIIAALIGAGASPEFVRQSVVDLNFKRFLTAPVDGEVEIGRFGSLARTWPFRLLVERSVVGRMLLYGGAYSSSQIEAWLNELLRQLLPSARSPVRFADLIVPTRIVATDLGTGQARVWSTDGTPDDSVALAVRSSCSIPGFFQAVHMGGTRLVDGGLLSNLPAFVFASPKPAHSLGGRILAFSLEDSGSLPPHWGLREVATRLVGAVIGGATALQCKVQPGVHVIAIPTHGIAATDFDSMTPDVASHLFAEGRAQTIAFIRNESLQLQQESAIASQAVDSEELYAEFVREAEQVGTELVVADYGTDWFWKLFPTILAWRLAGARVFALTARPHDSGDQLAREQQRRSILSMLGVRLATVDSLPFRGFVLRRSDDHGNAAFIISDSSGVHAPFGSMYVGSMHRAVIHVLYERLMDLVPSGAPKSPEPIRLSPIAVDQLISRLKTGVRQYEPADVIIESATLQVRDLMMITRRVRAYKLRQIEILARSYGEYGLTLFEAASIQLADGAEISTVTPPVIEQHGDTFVTIEGNTRLYYAHELGLESIGCLLVRGVRAPLPGSPLDPRFALVSTYSLPPSERSSKFDYQHFRSIEGAARPL